LEQVTSPAFCPSTWPLKTTGGANTSNGGAVGTAVLVPVGIALDAGMRVVDGVETERRFEAGEISHHERAVAHGRNAAGMVGGMAAALGVADPDPNTLFALTSSNPEWTALQPSAPPAAFSNNHLGYALTWFGLALALVGFYIVLLRKTLMQPRSASEAIGKEESS
jgi:hypothetical protein